MKLQAPSPAIAGWGWFQARVCNLYRVGDTGFGKAYWIRIAGSDLKIIFPHGDHPHEDQPHVTPFSFNHVLCKQTQVMKLGRTGLVSSMVSTLEQLQRMSIMHGKRILHAVCKRRVWDEMCMAALWQKDFPVDQNPGTWAKYYAMLRDQGIELCKAKGNKAQP